MTSTGTKQVSSLGGCIGTEAQWAIQETEWREKVLGAFDVPYLHMKEIKSGRDKFAQFKDRARCDELFDAVTNTFKKSGVRPIGNMTRLQDLHRINSERGRCLNAYALNIYRCMVFIKQIYREQLVGDAISEMRLDANENTGPAIDAAYHYAATDLFTPNITQHVTALKLPLGRAKSLPALQAADFIAWEIRVWTEQQAEFWDNIPDGLTTQDLRAAHAKWSKHHEWPFKRKSMRDLMTGRNSIMGVWTYRDLCMFDDARSGVWSLGDRKKKAKS
jgi:hypothetical protein